MCIFTAQAFAYIYMWFAHWILSFIHACQRQEKYTEAIAPMERALSILAKRLGKNHPDTVETRNGLELVRKETSA